MSPRVSIFARIMLSLSRTPAMVPTGYRPRGVSWVTNLAPYYSVVRVEQRVEVVANRWPPMWSQLMAWGVIAGFVAIAVAIVVNQFQGRMQVVAGAVAAAPVLLGAGGILFAVYAPNAAADRRVALVIDKRAGVVEVALSGERVAAENVRAVQEVNFSVRVGISTERQSEMFRHLVLRCGGGEGERYVPVLETGYPMRRLGRAIAMELGVPLEFAWAEVDGERA